MDLVVGNPVRLFFIRVFDLGEEALILLIDFDCELLLEFVKILGFLAFDIGKQIDVDSCRIESNE